eukprot:3874642-Rhodomonas_salina.1
MKCTDKPAEEYSTACLGRFQADISDDLIRVKHQVFGTERETFQGGEEAYEDKDKPEEEYRAISFDASAAGHQ